MARTDKPKQATVDHEEAIIARALYEAANRHADPHDMGNHFRDDREVGRQMRAVLDARFPDHARAFGEADAMRDALSKGYLPPPSGATSESVRLFLAQHETAREARRTMSRPPAGYGLDVSDIPF